MHRVVSGLTDVHEPVKHSISSMEAIAACKRFYAEVVSNRTSLFPRRFNFPRNLVQTEEDRALFRLDEPGDRGGSKDENNDEVSIGDGFPKVDILGGLA